MTTPTKITVHSLRKSGYKVHINHYRYIDNPNEEHNLTSYFHIRNEKWQDRVQVKGGLTTVEILDKDLKPLHMVEARCSKKDAFCRKVALDICLGRLQQVMNNGSV